MEAKSLATKFTFHFRLIFNKPCEKNKNITLHIREKYIHFLLDGTISRLCRAVPIYTAVPAQHRAAAIGALHLIRSTRSFSLQPRQLRSLLGTVHRCGGAVGEVRTAVPVITSLATSSRAGGAPALLPSCQPLSSRGCETDKCENN